LYLPVKEVLGEVMRETRLDLRISTTEAAKRAKISKSYWSKIESGYVWPAPQKLLSISGALNLYPSEMFYQMGELLNRFEGGTTAAEKKRVRKDKLWPSPAGCESKI